MKAFCFDHDKSLLALLLRHDSLLHVRPNVDGADRAQAGADPVDNEVLDRRVTSASELERGGQYRVEVAAAGAERQAHHARRDKAVDRRRVLGLLQWNQSGAETAHKRGHALDDCPMEHWHRQIRRADIVDSRVGTADMSFSNLKRPQNLN